MSAPHHGSKDNFDRELVERIDPTIVVAAANYPSYGHPDPSVVTETCAAGAFMWVTSADPNSRLDVDEWFHVLQ
jgi:beta-lactamase superfamily II metal-dependent hydrolase